MGYKILIDLLSQRMNLFTYAFLALGTISLVVGFQSPLKEKIARDSYTWEPPNDSVVRNPDTP